MGATEQQTFAWQPVAGVWRIPLLGRGWVDEEGGSDEQGAGSGGEGAHFGASLSGWRSALFAETDLSLTQAGSTKSEPLKLRRCTAFAPFQSRFHAA